MNAERQIRAARFRDRNLAFRYSDHHSVKATLVILGDDDRFWVVSMAVGERLIRAGYVVANR